MEHWDSKSDDVLMEVIYENGHIKTIRYRQSTNESFEEMKFCSVDSDGYFYDHSIFDMTDMI